jgi:hypothetical protein
VLPDRRFLALEKAVTDRKSLHNFSAQFVVPSSWSSHCWISRRIHLLGRLLNCAQLGGAKARIPDTNRRNSGLWWPKFGTTNDDDEILRAAVLQDRGMITES